MNFGRRIEGSALFHIIDCSCDVYGNALFTTLRNTASVRYIEIQRVIRSPESDGRAKQRIFRDDVIATGAMMLRQRYNVLCKTHITSCFVYILPEMNNLNWIRRYLKQKRCFHYENLSMQ